MPYKSNTMNHYVTTACLFLGFLCDIGFNLRILDSKIIIKIVYFLFLEKTAHVTSEVAIMTGWGNNKENDL